MQENAQIRAAARIAGVQLYRVAAELKISEPTLSRWLRFPLPEEKASLIMGAISRLKQEAI